VKRRGGEPGDDPPVNLTGAFGDLERVFREAGEKKEEERQRSVSEQEFRGRRPSRRGFGRHLVGRVAATVFGFCLLGGGLAVGTGVFTSDDGTRGSGGGVPPETRHARGDAFRGLAVSADPTRHGQNWGVGVYPSANGHDTCVLAGTVRGAVLGMTHDGKFAGLDNTFVGQCDDVDRQHVVFTTRNYFSATGSRTLLYGYADRSVTALKVGPRNALKRLRVANDGTFLVVRTNPNALRGQLLEVDRGQLAASFTLQPERRPPKKR
jgi:hypothetical protein